MLALLLLAQMATGIGARDTVYVTPSIRELIEAAAAANRAPPRALRGYRARVESELSLLVRDTLGREQAAQIEQLAMAARWAREDGSYELHVIGYRSQSVGVPYSALSFARSWTVPYLYGDRFTLGIDMARGIRRTKRGRADSTRDNEPYRAIHPLGGDRDRYYRFSGGDTIAVIRADGRAIPIVRVRVTPRFPDDTSREKLAAFDGELDLDAVHHQIVRMRGMFVASHPGTGRSILARLPGVVAVAFVEFVNGERLGRYWLPTFQRTEFQASFAALGSQRSVFRLVSSFQDLRVSEDSTLLASDSAATAGSDSLVGLADSASYRRRLTYAPNDSLSRFADWMSPLGAETSRVSGSDFDDMAPDAWRPTGPPRVELAANSMGDLFRYDRVEGAYTGAALAIRFRDLAPGLSARAFGGWAWTENTARGGAVLSLQHASWLTSVRAERSLESTNDFTGPLGGGAGLGALLGGPDDQDYVDRRIAALGATHVLGRVDRALVSTEVGLGSDHTEVSRLQRGVLGTSFLPNRASDNGRYVRGRAQLEWHPDVTGVFLEPGFGAHASYEIGRGDLNWERIELALAMRYQLSNVTLAARAEGGVILGRTPPSQVMFELGSEGALPGYAYKEFGGDRAATAGLLASYTAPLLRRPWRLIRTLILPGLSPGLAGGIQSGWAEISSDGARAAIMRMADSPVCGPVTDACPAAPLLSRPTDGIRATVDARLTVFGGVLGIGIARPIDRAAPWRLVFRAGQEF